MRYVGVSSPSNSNAGSDPPRSKNRSVYADETPVGIPSSHLIELIPDPGQPQSMDRSVYPDGSPAQEQHIENSYSSHSDADSEPYIFSDSQFVVVEEEPSFIPISSRANSPALETIQDSGTSLASDGEIESREPIHHSVEVRSSETLPNVAHDGPKSKKIIKKIVNRGRRDSQDSESGELEAMRLDMKANGIHDTPGYDEKMLYRSTKVPRDLKFIAMRDGQRLKRDSSLVNSPAKWKKVSTFHRKEIDKYPELSD